MFFVKRIVKCYLESYQHAVNMNYIYRYQIFLIISPNSCKTFKKKKCVVSIQLFRHSVKRKQSVFALNQKRNPFISYESVDLRSHHSTRTQWQGRFESVTFDQNLQNPQKQSATSESDSDSFIPFLVGKLLKRYNNTAVVQIICSLNRVPVCVGNTS